MSAPACPRPIPADQPLTAEQLARSEALYRCLEQLRRSGVRQALITFAKHDHPWGVGPVGRRVEVP